MRQAHAQALCNWELLLTGPLSSDVYERAFGGRDGGDGAARAGYADAEALVTDKARGVGILQLVVEREFRTLVADAPEASAALIADLVKAFRAATAVRPRAGARRGPARGALTRPRPASHRQSSRRCSWSGASWPSSRRSSASRRSTRRERAGGEGRGQGVRRERRSLEAGGAPHARSLPARPLPSP